MGKVMSKRARAGRAAAWLGLLSGGGLFGSAALALGFLAGLLAVFGVFYVWCAVSVQLRPSYDFPRADWTLDKVLKGSAQIYGCAGLAGLLAAGAWRLARRSATAWKRLDASAPVLPTTLERLESAETLVRASASPGPASDHLLRASSPGPGEAGAEVLLRAGDGGAG